MRSSRSCANGRTDAARRPANQRQLWPWVRTQARSKRIAGRWSSRPSARIRRHRPLGRHARHRQRRHRRSLARHARKSHHLAHPVWGMGHGTRVGQGETDVVTRKDLIVRMEAPRFFVQTDEVVLSAIVHNYLKMPSKSESASNSTATCLEPPRRHRATQSKSPPAASARRLARQSPRRRRSRRSA